MNFGLGEFSHSHEVPSPAVEVLASVKRMWLKLTFLGEYLEMVLLYTYTESSNLIGPLPCNNSGIPPLLFCPCARTCKLKILQRTSTPDNTTCEALLSGSPHNPTAPSSNPASHTSPPPPPPPVFFSFFTSSS